MENILKETDLDVHVYPNRAAMGKSAAKDAAAEIKRLLSVHEQINMIFAAAPSQNEFLDHLVQQEVEWCRINGFHMDEYVGLPVDAPQAFAHFLKERLFNRVNFKTVHYIDGNGADPNKECERYARLLTENTPHIVCMGIGENAHIAFNDPHVADFNDDKLVKVVDLDEACRQQQVNDGCFASLEEVPRLAITLTIPALYRAQSVFCIVPGERKANAVYHTIHGKINEDCPATILRLHPSAVLYLDQYSAQKLKNSGIQ